jgi:hypothetical protein
LYPFFFCVALACAVPMRILLNFHANTDAGVMFRIVLRTFIHFNASEEPPHQTRFIHTRTRTFAYKALSIV